MNSDTIIRTDKDSNYSIIDNYPINDDRLTFEARGVLNYLLSKPNTWQLSIKDIMKQGAIGRDKARRIIKELQTQGYIYRQKQDAKSKKFTWISIIFEHPTLNPHYDQPTLPLDTMPWKPVPGSTPGRETMPWKTVDDKTVDGKHVHIVNTDLNNNISPKREPGKSKEAESTIIEKRRANTAQWLKECKVPAPRDEATWKLVEHRTIVSWVIATNYWPGYDNLEFLISEFSKYQSIDIEILDRAWYLWKHSGNKKSNHIGVLDWYANLLDNSDWKPMSRRNNGNRKGTYSKADSESTPTKEHVNWYKSAQNNTVTNGQPR